MYAYILRRLTLAVAVAGMALSPALLSAAPAQAATANPGAVTAATAQWQKSIAHTTEQGAGCYQASYPSLSWHAVACVAAPEIPFAPAASHAAAAHAAPQTVGDGTDYSAVVSGLITKATGTFTNVSSGITEKGAVDGSGSQVSNSFSLQLNSQFFTGSPACSGASSPSSCQAWQQFVYTFNGGSTGEIFMQYWLIDYNASCPSGWYSYSPDCYTNSSATEVSAVTAKQLATVNLTGTAASGGNDAVSLSIGSGTAVTVTNKDTKIDLATNWNTAEWGVYGDGGGSAANFGSGSTIEAQTSLTDTASGAPSCVEEGFTGETNNLKLTSTPALGTESSPTMATEQTNGTSGTASCATAAG
ncbi:hypothetical protein KDL01_08255 [Actinospica durhamensis]|uniref:Secreted protein n=1 Tax=Actinospica durhamensis TaxID=1508375 RepID=A0A941ESX0_9ACTN|nr:hypothetical protein [Actinospica durhamensis]MBR7833254.1 hypothetical protein [Actinospica durhamensis]